jgi:hypothetical protein
VQEQDRPVGDAPGGTDPPAAQAVPINGFKRDAVAIGVSDVIAS